ncbi:unnamed protein product, partial [Trichogramma brassicae]
MTSVVQPVSPALAAPNMIGPKRSYHHLQPSNAAPNSPSKRREHRGRDAAWMKLGPKPRSENHVVVERGLKKARKRTVGSRAGVSRAAQTLCCFCSRAKKCLRYRARADSLHNGSLGYETLSKGKKSWSVRLGLSRGNSSSSNSRQDVGSMRGYSPQRQHHSQQQQQQHQQQPQTWATLSGGSILAPADDVRRALALRHRPGPSEPSTSSSTTAAAAATTGLLLSRVPWGCLHQRRMLKSSVDDPYDLMRRSRLLEPRSRARSISPSSQQQQQQKQQQQQQQQQQQRSQSVQIRCGPPKSSGLKVEPHSRTEWFDCSSSGAGPGDRLDSVINQSKLGELYNIEPRFRTRPQTNLIRARDWQEDAGPPPPSSLGNDSRRSILECDVNPYLLLKGPSQLALQDLKQHQQLQQQQKQQQQQREQLQRRRDQEEEEEDRLSDELSDNALEQPRVSSLFDPSKVKSIERIALNRSCSVAAIGGQRVRLFNEPSHRDESSHSEEDDQPLCNTSHQLTRIPIPKISPKRPPRRLKEARNVLKSILKQAGDKQRQNHNQQPQQKHQQQQHQQSDVKRKSVLFNVDNVILAPEKPAAPPPPPPAPPFSSFSSFSPVNSSDAREQGTCPQRKTSKSSLQTSSDRSEATTSELPIVAQESTIERPQRFITIPNIKSLKQQQQQQIPTRQQPLQHEAKIVAKAKSPPEIKIDKYVSSKKPQQQQVQDQQQQQPKMSQDAASKEQLDKKPKCESEAKSSDVEKVEESTWQPKPKPTNDPTTTTTTASKAENNCEKDESQRAGERFFNQLISIERENKDDASSRGRKLCEARSCKNVRVKNCSRFVNKNRENKAIISSNRLIVTANRIGSIKLHRYTIAIYKIARVDASLSPRVLLTRVRLQPSYNAFPTHPLDHDANVELVLQWVDATQPIQARVRIDDQSRSRVDSLAQQQRQKQQQQVRTSGEDPMSTVSNICKITLKPATSTLATTQLVHRLQKNEIFSLVDLSEQQVSSSPTTSNSTSITINGESHDALSSETKKMQGTGGGNKVTISIGGNRAEPCNPPTVISVNSGNAKNSNGIGIGSLGDDYSSYNDFVPAKIQTSADQKRTLVILDNYHRSSVTIEPPIKPPASPPTQAADEACCWSRIAEAPSKEQMISQLLEDSLRKARQNGEIVDESSGEAILKILKQSLLKGSCSDLIDEDEEDAYEIIKEPIYEEIPEEPGPLPPPLPLSPPPSEAELLKSRIFFGDLEYEHEGFRDLSTGRFYKPLAGGSNQYLECSYLSKEEKAKAAKASLGKTGGGGVASDPKTSSSKQQDKLSSKFELLNFIVDSEERTRAGDVALDEDEDEEDDDDDDDDAIIDDDEDEDDEDPERDLEALYEQKEMSLGDLSSKSSQISNVSDSSEECNIILVNSSESRKARSVDIERTDSGVGSESSQASSGRGGGCVGRRWRHLSHANGDKSNLANAPASQSHNGNNKSPVNASNASNNNNSSCSGTNNNNNNNKLDVKHCEDCEQRIEPHLIDGSSSSSSSSSSGSGSGNGRGPSCSVCRKCAKKRIERKEIVTEIVETEQKYGRDLHIILEEFHRPMLRAGLLTPEQLSAIFLNVEELLEHNHVLAHKLKRAVELALESGDADLLSLDLGKIFLESERMLHAFESYCTRQGGASLLLQNLEKEKELLRIFLKVSQMENAVLRRMNLNSFLMVPVQRVTKYPLLLARLLKATPSARLDMQELKKRLKQAQTNIELHLEHMNAVGIHSYIELSYHRSNFDFGFLFSRRPKTSLRRSSGVASPSSRATDADGRAASKTWSTSNCERWPWKCSSGPTRTRDSYSRVACSWPNLPTTIGAEAGR